MSNSNTVHRFVGIFRFSMRKNRRERAGNRYGRPGGSPGAVRMGFPEDQPLCRGHRYAPRGGEAKSNYGKQDVETGEGPEFVPGLPLQVFRKGQDFLPQGGNFQEKNGDRPPS